MLECTDVEYTCIGKFAWWSKERSLWCLLCNTWHWYVFLHQVCWRQVTKHLGRQQVCYQLQSTWLCGLMFCLGTWYIQECIMGLAYWFCYHWFAHVVCKACTVLWNICQFHLQVISTIWSCLYPPGVSIVSGRPVTWVKSFPVSVASYWVVFIRCGGRFTLGSGTGVDNTLESDFWWHALEWCWAWMAQSSVLATSTKALRNGGRKFRGEFALSFAFFKRYNISAVICLR